MQFPDNLRKLTILILDLMCLIDDDVVPLDALETVQADTYSLETSHQDIELPLIHHVAQDLLTLILCCDQLHHSSTGHPFLKLVHPISKSDLGSNHDVWTTHFLELFYEGKDGDGLNGLTQTHIVSKDTTDATLIETDHPIKPYQLIVLQEATLKDGWLFCQSSENVLVMLFLFDHILDLFVLFFKVAALLGLGLVMLS